MKVILEDLRRNVQDVLDKRQMSRKDLADSMGVSPSYVTQILNGYHEPGLVVVERLAQALRVPYSRILKPRRPNDNG